MAMLITGRKTRKAIPYYLYNRDSAESLQVDRNDFVANTLSV